MKEDLFLEEADKNYKSISEARFPSGLLELGKNLAFEKRVEQMLISACQKSNYTTIETMRSA